jgi:hypothetical protein
LEASQGLKTRKALIFLGFKKEVPRSGLEPETN